MRRTDRCAPRAEQTLRAAALVAVAVAALAEMASLAADPLLSVRAQLAAGVAWSALPLDLLVQGLAAAALSVCGAWLSLVVAATATEVAVAGLTGLSVGASRALTPALVRRCVLLCCGIAVGGTGLVSPAIAQTVRSGPSQVAVTTEEVGLPTPRPGLEAPASRLEGLALPDRATGTVATIHPGKQRTSIEADGPATRRRPPGLPLTSSRSTVVVLPIAAGSASGQDGQAPRVHRVRAGESLWSIAEHLLPHAGPSRVDAAWRLIHRTNRKTVGPDPDLLIPGTTLRLPPSIHSDTAARPGDSDATLHRKDPS